MENQSPHLIETPIYEDYQYRMPKAQVQMTRKYNALYIGSNQPFYHKMKSAECLDIKITQDPIDAVKLKDQIDLILFEGNEDKQTDILIKFIIENLSNDNKILFVISEVEISPDHYLKLGVHDVFNTNVIENDVVERYEFLRGKNNPIGVNLNETQDSYEIPGWKRAFDIVFASIAIILLSPLFLLISILIWLESKGKVFYTSPRVGSGYKFFGFYKFRSMYTDADKRVGELMSKNQYASNIQEDEATSINTHTPELVSDEGYVQESKYLKEKKIKQENGFVKFVNDPRITKVGRFLRNTSIDELPQLFNVLKGDMSVVGNRPLPLYEAETLTTDLWVERFLAPAGLTGLWQVTKRGGKNKMSSDERKQLDIIYGKNYSFWYDLKIILKTLPAMLQHENV